MGLLRRTQPAIVTTDRVVPLRYWDDLDYLRSLCHDFTFRFDDVLDTEKLKAGLDQLTKIGDWGQLGARLRLNVRISQIQKTPLTRPSDRIENNWNTTSLQSTTTIDRRLPSPQPSMA